MLGQALTLQLGYNATLVMLGATLLGIAAGVTGTFLYLSKRALVSDAISHAALPGIGLAFLAMVALGGDGRWLPGLLAGATLSAGAGLVAVSALKYRTRLGEDAAIGAVLSVFFGFGVVLLTLIQPLEAGRQAGLDSFVLGATAGMLRQDALTILIGGALILLVLLALRRPMLMVAFDPGHALALGLNIRRIEGAMMALALAVTVIGLKIVGLIMIVAMLIIPPVAARFWSNDAMRVALIAGGIGGSAGYVGTAISAVVPDLPTGPIIVMVAFALFVISLLAAPGRGVLAGLLARARFRRRVHLRQGLLALVQGQPIYEGLTLRLMRRAGYLRRDGVATEAGRARAAQTLLDENRWALIRHDPAYRTALSRHDGLAPLDRVLTADQIREIDARLQKSREVIA